MLAVVGELADEGFRNFATSALPFNVGGNLREVAQHSGPVDEARHSGSLGRLLEAVEMVAHVTASILGGIATAFGLDRFQHFA